MDTDHASSQAQDSGLANSTEDNSFRFTPIKAIRALPRLWERKPSTPFKGGIKPRKLWKRFQTSFSNMQTLQDTSAIIENAPFHNAISVSKDSGYTRGTKRMRIGPGETENRTEAPQTGRSFFETQWDSEAARKKRKLPDTPFDIFDEKTQSAPLFAGSQFDGPTENVSAQNSSKNLKEVNIDFATTTSPLPPSMQQTRRQTLVYQDEANAEGSGSSASDAITPAEQESEASTEEQDAVVDSVSNEGIAEAAPTPTKAVKALTQEQKGKLVRSALRSSLDGEDAELLNNFLSRAKAKRAAKAQEPETDETGKSTTPEDSPDAECATPRARRALEDLDTNSPSPVKAQVSPLKGEIIADDETPDVLAKKDPQDNVDDEQAPANNACRRSTRVKAPSAEAPSARNKISLRRAKGTEFVFLQRTEAQELALATKRNTRNNRGQSVMPKYALETLALQTETPETTESTRPGRKPRKGPSGRQTRKNVSWNEERLAAYEDEEQAPELQDDEEEVGKKDVSGTSRARSGAKKPEKKKSLSSSRSSRSQLHEESREENADIESGPTTSTAAATPRSRRMRRVGESTMTSGTPVKTGSGRISKPPVTSTSTVAGPSTPTKGRRKLVPKSPSSSMLPTPATKTAEPSFTSGIPTRAVSNEGPRRKTTLEASAGCTPMPKRVRART
ncbi:uncharacterized protein N7469_010642 [Penicillium citrinum]|uniref:Uncharacterized protein n=1 Tax=Penicillium citrinum TaxID=5077 RepID=A0A9W9NKQ5_PENCI|nr:uncharacterized protein N7469_010642 [Penicillium citrinum]KAJ5221755.1 hypothetical protein N7469_010642 [Penicillium citrinum]